MFLLLLFPRLVQSQELVSQRSICTSSVTHHRTPQVSHLSARYHFFAFNNLSIMSFAFITPASLKPFSPEAVAAITMSGSYSVNQESEFDSSSNGSSEDETVISDTESEESDDEEDERFQAISPNRLKGFSTHNADPDRVLSSFTSTGQRSLISRNSRKQLSLQAALGSFRTLPSSILCSTY